MICHQSITTLCDPSDPWRNGGVPGWLFVTIAFQSSGRINNFSRHNTNSSRTAPSQNMQFPAKSRLSTCPELFTSLGHFTASTDTRHRRHSSLLWEGSRRYSKFLHKKELKPKQLIQVAALKKRNSGPHCPTGSCYSHVHQPGWIPATTRTAGKDRAMTSSRRNRKRRRPTGISVNAAT